MVNADEFIQGQKDCKEGKQTTGNESDDYLRGYAAQYNLEQIMGEITREH